MSPLLQSIVWCVIQVTLFALVAGLVYLVARRWTSALAGGVLVGSLALIVLLTLAAASPWPRWSWDSPPAAAPQPTATTLPTTDENPTSEPANTEVSLDSTAASPYAAAWQAFTAALSEPTAATTSGANATAWNAAQLFRWLLAACLVLSGIRLAWGLWQVRQLRLSSEPVTDAQALAVLAQLTTQLQLSPTIALRESPDLGTAATFGWRQQFVLLPPAWRQWSASQLRAVLAHELSHVAARDYRWWLVARLAVAIHFYHPLVRWLAGRLQLEQELAADASAAHLLGDRQQYLECLAALALATPSHQLTGPARTLVPNRSLLMRRVEMLRTSPKLRSLQASTTLRRVAIGCMAVVALAVAGLRQPVVSQEESGGGATAEKDDAVVLEFVAKPDRIPARYIPRQTKLVISVRVQDILRDKALIKQIDELTADTLLGEAELSVADISEVMIQQLTDRPYAERTIVRFATPAACQQAFVAAVKASDSPLRTRPSTSLLVGRSGGTQYTQLDASTLAFDRNRGDADLPITDNNTPPAWAQAWSDAADRPVVVAVDIAQKRAESGALDANQSDLILRTLVPIANHTDWVVGSIGIDKGVDLHVLAQCDNDQHAEQVANITQALITLGGGLVDQQAAQFDEQIQQLPLEERPRVVELVNKGKVLIKDFVANAHPVAKGPLVTLDHHSEAMSGDEAELMVQLLLPAVHAARQAAMRTMSANNMRQIALAMHNYHDTYGHFPAAQNYAAGSKHPHSWRVALLPFLEQQAIYDQYHLDEPWDSEANLKFAKTVVPVYRSPFDKGSSTNASYFALTGPDTVFFDPNGAKFRTIIDGTSHTIMFVEAKRDIPWTKPEDIPYDAEKPLPELGGWMPGIFQAAMCDGSVRVISQQVDEKTLRAMITRDGREVIDSP